MIPAAFDYHAPTTIGEATHPAARAQGQREHRAGM
jgi:hypothetical protein